MIDFELNIEVETTASHIIYFLLIYVIVLFFNRDLFKCDFLIDKSLKWGKRKLLLFGSILLLIAAYTRGDFYHYYDLVKDIYSEHMEDFYQWLAIVVDRNYLLWRCVVWGAAFLFLNITAKRLNVNNVLVCFVLFAIFIPYFNYARASLAFSVYFFGLSFFLSIWKSRLLSYFLGLSIIYLSHYFHSSAYILIAITPIIFVPISRKIIVFSVLLFPIMTYLMESYLFGDESILDDSIGNGLLEERLQHYQEESLQLYNGISAILHYVLHYGTFFVMTLLIGMELYTQDRDSIDKRMTKLYTVNISIIIAALSFAVVSTSAVFFYRVLYMTIIPLCLLFAYLLQNKLIRLKWEKICWGIGIINILYECFYDLYLKMWV